MRLLPRKAPSTLTSICPVSNSECGARSAGRAFLSIWDSQVAAGNSRPYPGYHANDRPGLGIDLNEDLAAKFPVKDDPPFDMMWGNTRRRDGTIQKP